MGWGPEQIGLVPLLEEAETPELSVCACTQAGSHEDPVRGSEESTLWKSTCPVCGLGLLTSTPERK